MKKETSTKMARPTYYKGGDYPFDLELLNDDGSAMDMTKVINVFAYALVNKREQERYALNTTSGYKDIVQAEGGEDNELIIPFVGEDNAKMPSGLLEWKIDVIYDEDYFDAHGNKNSPIMIESGWLK